MRPAKLKNIIAKSHKNLFVNRYLLAFFSMVIFVSTTLVTSASMTTPTNQGNLLVNGSFEDGNKGFTSEYTNDNSLSSNKTYAIAKNPSALVKSFPSFGDNTSGTGNMMIVRSARGIFKIWTQTIDVEPNTDYELSGAFTKLKNEQVAPKVGFYINNALVENAKFTQQAGVWKQFKQKWNSKSKTSATITIRNLKG